MGMDHELLLLERGCSWAVRSSVSHAVFQQGSRKLETQQCSSPAHGQVCVLRIVVPVTVTVTSDQSPVTSDPNAQDWHPTSNICSRCTRVVTRYCRYWTSSVSPNRMDGIGCNHLPHCFREQDRTGQNSAKDPQLLPGSCPRGAANLFQGPPPRPSLKPNRSPCCTETSQNGLPSLLESSRLRPTERYFLALPQSRAEIAGPCASVFSSVPLAKYPSNLCHGGPALSSPLPD